MKFYKRFLVIVILSFICFISYQRYFAKVLFLKENEQVANLPGFHNNYHNKEEDRFAGGVDNSTSSSAVSLGPHQIYEGHELDDGATFLLESSADIKTLDLLDHVEKRFRKGEILELNFDHFEEDDGVQGFLQAIVVPHSHNDPGWLRTIEEYFAENTESILNNMLEKLIEHQEMTFVWAETVFLSMWWNNLTDEKRKIFNMLVESGRLEIVGGGWVVPDEAVTHYSSLILNFLEGHRWLKNKILFKPKITWSLDPFGYSSFFPYLYNRIGYKSSIILRVNTYIKTEMAMKKLLHFKWRQNWDGDGLFDSETFMLPFMLYNIKHQCGPDKLICLQFDFRNIPGESSESRAEEVKTYNVASLAWLLTDQFKKKASLQMNKNVVLIPIGDDFRFDQSIEWDQQYNNFMKLFRYINKTPELGVKVKFGTVSEFFNMMARHNKKFGIHEKERDLFTLSGDFFPYTDRDNDYWTGFYTTRMWLKKLIRTLEHTLNVAEMIHLNAVVHASKYNIDWSQYAEKVDALLTKARQTASLMQHHDAITGTSTNYVTKNMKESVVKALRAVEQAAQKSMHYLFTLPLVSHNFISHVIEDYKFFMLTESLSSQIWSTNNVMLSKSNVYLIVFNPSLHHSNAIMSFTIELVNHSFDLIKSFFKGSNVNESSKFVLKRFHGIENKDGKHITACHVHKFQSFSDKFILSYTDVINPMSFALYSISLAHKGDDDSNICDSQQYQVNNSSFDQPIVLENDCMKAYFDSTTGHLLRYKLPGNKHFKVEVKFMAYDSSKDGAYIFGTLSKAREFEPKKPNVINVLKGRLYSGLMVHMDDLFVVDYRLPMSKCNSDVFDLHIDVSVNMTRNLYNNIDLIMRVNTELKSQNYFYTDSNGYSTILRKRLPALPIEANYYPATSYIFIQNEENTLLPGLNKRYNGAHNKNKQTNKENMDDNEKLSFSDYRITLLMKEPRGVSSQHSGSLEAMLDRKSVYSDGRGMGDSIMDNLPITSSFHLLLEKVERFSQVHNKSIIYDQRSKNDGRFFRHPTLSAINVLQMLRNKPSGFTSTLPLTTLLKSISHLEPLYQNRTYPCDLSLAFVRHMLPTIQKSEKNLNVSALVVLHRFAAELGSSSTLMCNSLNGFHKSYRSQLKRDCGSLSLKRLFPHDNLVGSRESSLTLLRVEKSPFDVNSDLCLNASSLHSYLLQFAPTPM